VLTEPEVTTVSQDTSRDTSHPTSEMETRYRELAAPLLRLFVAFVLVYGTQDNVFSSERMLEFRDFLARNGFPYPTFCAHLSAYAQFVTGILLALGLFTRWAASVVVVNFVVALWMVHRALPFTANIAPLAMLMGGLFFLLYGAPRYSLDARWRRRAAPR
jgi:putative oxidoreductase